MTRLRWAVLGAGRFGRVHCRVLRSISDVHLVAACTRNQQHQAELATELPGLTCHASFAEVIDDPGIDGVTIVTHWRDHFQAARASLLAGKHVLLEKPMAPTFAECSELLEIAEQSPGRLMIGHVCRFDPRTSLAREAIAAGEIGRVTAIHARRNLPKAPGNIRLDKISPLMGDGIHDADLMMWFLDATPKSVYARNIRVFDYSYPDIGWAMLHFESSEGEAIGVVETNWGLPENVSTLIDARLEVVGTEGKLTVDCANTGLTILGRHGERSRDTAFWPQQHGQVIGALRAEVQYFIDCARRGVDPQVITNAEAARAVKVMELAERSALEGRQIDVT